MSATTTYLDTRATAEHLNVSPNTLSRWRWTGDGPAFLKMGRSVRYARSDLDAWVAERKRHSTSEPA